MIHPETAMELTIRDADHSDVEDLVPLYRQFVEDSMCRSAGVSPNPKLDPRRALTRLLQTENSVLLVAQLEGRLVGFAFVEFRHGMNRRRGILQKINDWFGTAQSTVPVLLPSRAWLSHIFIPESHRRQGIASRLMDAVSEWAQDQGATVLELNCMADNESARELYEKIGMQNTLVRYWKQL